MRAPPRALPSEALDALATPSGSFEAALRVADVSVDAWSVGGGSALALFGAKFAGIETKLFQAGLAPYLAYLYFLGRAETGTPRASLFGARFLLLFVIATIPAGIVAKTAYGDILANVDVLHGSSETLLSVSNFLFAFGFADALAKKSDAATNDDASKRLSGGSSGTSTPEPPSESFEALSAPVALLAFAAMAGLGSYGAGQLIHSEIGTRFLTETLHARVEPKNALSAQTWAVHVSSVAEWALAMRLVARYAKSEDTDTPGDDLASWRFLPVAMAPFLASGFAACTFHAFYNPPSINALVPLQALLTLLGNAGCAFAAFKVYDEGFKKKERDDKRRDETDETPAFASATADAAPLTVSSSGKGGVAVSSVVASASFVVLGASLCVATPLVCGDFFFEPSYEKALPMIAAPTLLWAVFGVGGVIVDDTASSDFGKKEKKKRSSDASSSLSSSNEPSEEDKNEEDRESGFARVKAFGAAGTASYVIVELAFWAAALPAAIAWYRVAEGSWLDLSIPADKAKLLGAGAVFINVVRFFVPFRLAAALALAPAVRRTFFESEPPTRDAEDDGRT
jgi:disulfide bond formation protein DsbB